MQQSNTKPLIIEYDSTSQASNTQEKFSNDV